MKLYLTDLLKEEWLKKAITDTKSQLINVGSGKILVFYYGYGVFNELIISKEEIRYEINDDIYRSLARETTPQIQHVGFLQEPFDSTNYLFYSYLKYVVGNTDASVRDRYRRDLHELFLEYQEMDSRAAKEKSKSSIIGVFDIFSPNSLLDALTEFFYFNRNPINGLRIIFDMFDSYMKRTANVSFYGEVLQQIVRLVKNPNGGVINQNNGTLRYLIIGEVAAKDDSNLKEAKKQLREGVDSVSIYLNTGWFFNKFDGKWRKRISDDGFLFKSDSLIKSQDYSMLNDEGYIGGVNNLNTDLIFLSEKNITINHLIQNNYTRKVYDLINHPNLEYYYPNLNKVFLLYLNSKQIYSDSFYYSDSIPRHINLMAKDMTQIEVESIALHEIQHYIQRVEGFGNGGNTNLAQLINSVGGENTRDYINSIESFKKIVLEKNKEIDTDSLFNDVSLLVYGYNPNNVNELINKTATLCYNRDRSVAYSSDIAMNLLNLYCAVDNLRAGIKKLITKFYGDNYITTFENIVKKSNDVLIKNQELIQRGWTANDIYMLNFQTYEALMGEVESRFVQETQYVPNEFKDYFTLYTSESVLPEKITVINEIPPLDIPKDVKAAIELAEGKYIIHLPDEYSNTINILHELGHIMYDIMENVYSISLMQSQYESEYTKHGYTSFEEYVCDSFVDFIHRFNVEQGLTDDLNENRKIENYNSFDAKFKSILLENSMEIDAEKLEKMLNFVNSILK
jgi:hypothetical protein